MNSKSERLKIISDLDGAIKKGATANDACKTIGLSLRTLQRWKKCNEGDLRPTTQKKPSIKELTDVEKDEIVFQCNSSEFKDMTPNQIVPVLAERGVYIASESSFYKVLKEQKLLVHRENTKPPKKIPRPPALIATGPNQVLSWDITYLKTSVRGLYFYLYLFLDIWSRKIVGWTVADCESGDIASNTITKICFDANLTSIYLHSDNGSPMKCGTMLATLEKLGVTPSFSRPRVSNDNPFSESLFRTLKYRPAYPSVFKKIEDAIQWVDHFVSWYNNEHRHSGINFVTPEQRHIGLDIE